MNGRSRRGSNRIGSESSERRRGVVDDNRSSRNNSNGNDTVGIAIAGGSIAIIAIGSIATGIATGIGLAG